MKGLKILAIVLMLTFLTSCSGSDLNTTVFVSSMGVSLDNEVYAVTVFGSAAQEESIVPVSASGVGKTIEEAMSNAEKSCGLTLFLGHCNAIAANSAALKDSAMLSEFSGDVISPACPVYFSDSPERGAEKIPADGFETELYKLSVFSRNGTPAIIPTAEDPNRIAVITADETILTDSEDSLGIMILRNEAYPRAITVASGDSFETVKISPEASRSAYYSEGILNVDISVRLNIDEVSEESRRSVVGLIDGICGNAYEKTVNIMGIDAVGISSLTAYNEEALVNSRLQLTIET